MHSAVLNTTLGQFWRVCLNAVHKHMSSLKNLNLFESFVFASGNNSNNLLSFGDEHNRSKFELVSFWKRKNVISISGSETHTLFVIKCTITNRHLVYCLGEEIPCGHAIEQEQKLVTNPTLIPSLSDKQVIKVQAGINFSLALTKSGQVYAWGKLYKSVF